jgi:hypothetical protein
MSSSILQVTRGDVVEVYRLSLSADGAACLERFENGRFGPARVFRGWSVALPGVERGHVATEMERAIGHVSSYLDGAVTVGERDLLSPASAMTRNVRWLPGDLQMLESSVAYVRQLFPSAQFHVTQLLRRVFGDVAFIALIVLCSLFWLRVDAPAAPARLAMLLLIVSMFAIVGLGGYVAPIALAFRERFRVRTRGRRVERLAQWPVLIASGMLRGSVAVGLNTVIGLANLVINPGCIADSWRAVRRGKSLEWKASSASAVQDVRGWPLAEFLDAYRPALHLGLSLAAFVLWLIALGAPLGMGGLSGLGVFISSFLTAGLLAWYAALPRRLSDGAPCYRIPAREIGGLGLAGLIGLGLAGVAWWLGVYPLPAFEGSVGLVAMFLTACAAFALVFPSYHRLEYAWRRGPRGHRARRPLVLGALALLGACVAALLGRAPATESLGAAPPPPPQEVSAAGAGLASLSASRPAWSRALHLDEAAWRMPEPERRVYERVQQQLRLQGHADPQLELVASGAVVALSPVASIQGPDLHELRGAPPPRLPRIILGSPTRPLPRLYPLPAARRLQMVKPARAFLSPIRMPEPRAPVNQEVGVVRTLVAQRRVLALTPRALSPDELRAQADFIEHADYPWIGRDELRRLSQPAGAEAAIPLIEMARAERWNDIRRIWGRVPSATRGAPSERAQLQRLREGLEGVLSLGQEPTPENVERFSSEQLALVQDWSRRYPNVPFSALGDPGATTRGRFFDVARFLAQNSMSRGELAARWRLDYVDQYFGAVAMTPALHQAFRDRARVEPWEKLELDWEGNEALRQRWEDLQTEQAVGMRIWRAAEPDGAPPAPAELRVIITFLDHVLDRLQRRDSDPDGPYGLLADLFRLEGVDAAALDSGDTVAALLASQVWTRAMAGRLAQIVSKAAAATELFGSPEERQVIRETARLRHPDDAGDPLLRRVFEWLVLVDGAETYNELATGYDRFAGEAADMGLHVAGLARAPRFAQQTLFHDLVDVWRELPRRHPALPARADMVAEFLCQTAYFSSRDGRTPRTPRELLDDFGGALARVEAVMDEAPPAAVQRLTDLQFEQVQGRVSRSAAARRFFAWWAVAQQLEVIEHNAQRRGQVAHMDLSSVARDYAGVIEGGAARYPRLPWFQPGFAQYFSNLMAALGVGREALFERFDRELADADALLQRHSVPFATFESVVDRRIQEQTGESNIDPTLRRANALIALAQLCRALGENGLDDCRGSPGRVTEQFALLYERLSRDYPHLYWDSEGLIEFHLLVQRRQGWGLAQTVERFAPTFALADALAGAGWLQRFEARVGAGASGPEASLGRFMDRHAARLAQRTGRELVQPRARAMNALLALAGLLQSAAREGLLPGQDGAPWNDARISAWAAQLRAEPLASGISELANGLLTDQASLLDAMRAAGPAFPWQAGSIADVTLLAMRVAGASVEAMRAGLSPTWRAASELYARGVTPPAAFQQLVRADAAAELRVRIAAARGLPLGAVPADELEPEEPEQAALDATLALADILAAARLQTSSEPDGVALAARVVELRRLGPQRYPFLPWSEKGFVPSLVVAATGPDFAADFWRYAELAQFSILDRVLGELAASGQPLPAEILEDERAALYRETGRTPGSERLVALAAVRDGVSVLREFLPELPPTLPPVLALTRLRAHLRGLAADYAELGLIRGADASVRRGFAERLAALGMKRALAAGVPLDAPGFVDRGAALVEQDVLGRLKHVYSAVRASLSPEEIDYQRVTIADEARQDNRASAARRGISPERLGTPDVSIDDVVADTALYELAYATDIGRDQRYVAAVFDIFARIRQRPATQAAYRAGLAAIDAASAPVAPGAPGYERWRASAAYRRWWRERGDFLRTVRGQLIGLSRTFALVQESAFGAEADSEARAAFARFGSFDAYLDSVLSAYDAVAALPELSAALAALRAEDPHLADGVQFALALLSCHVIERLYPAPGGAERALAGISAQLPRVLAAQQRVLGFVPRLESGVPLYDARRAHLRSELQPADGTLYRLELLQRGVQRWTESYLLQQAYRILFFRELDPDDPTPQTGAGAPALLAGLHPWLDAVASRLLSPSRGQRTTEFLESRLPALLEARTGVRDVSVWVSWLMEHGEIALDGTPTGHNPYAAERARYEERLGHYRGLIERGRRSGRSVRAEEQRLRDVEREYASYRRQVGWLEQSAREDAALRARARQDYTRAVIAHALLPALLILLSQLGLRRASRHLAPRRPRLQRALAALGLATAFALGVIVPCGVAASPELAARLAPRALAAAGLLGCDAAGHPEPRGAAAQLARLEPWRLLEGGS